MGIEKKNYSFRFHEDMVERLRAQAQLENRSLSNLVEIDSAPISLHLRGENNMTVCP